MWWSVRVCLSQVRLLYVWIAAALLVVGSFLLLLVLQQRHMFVIAAMVCAVAVIHLLCSRLVRFVRSELALLPKGQPVRQGYTKYTEYTEYKDHGEHTEPIKMPAQIKMPMMQEAMSMRTPRLSLLLRAPETPMPEAPLIRVLETIDLSSCDVEHFLDTAPALESFHTPDENESFTDEYIV